MYSKTEKYIQQYDHQLALMNAFYTLRGRSLLRVLQRTRLVGFRYLLLLLMRKKIISDDVTVKNFLGVPMCLSVLDAGNQNMYLFGIPARKEAPLVKYILKNLNADDVFYDIGANYGVFTAIASPLITGGHIHVFEPNKSIIKKLTATIAYSNTDQNILLHEVALGSETATKIFYDYADSNDSSVSSLYVSNQSINDEHQVTSYQVQVVTLDQFITSVQLPTFLKVDIESAEYDFLMGAKDFLVTHNPTLALEFKLGSSEDRAHSKKCLVLLTSLGYTASRLNLAGEAVPLDDTIVMQGTTEHESYENIIFKKVV